MDPLIYKQYSKDFEELREALEKKYLIETRKYEARKIYRRTLVRKSKRTSVIKILRSVPERQRFFAVSMKWNWITRRKYDAWTALDNPFEKGKSNVYLFIYLLTKYLLFIK